MKNESRFRTGTVVPFLNKLPRTWWTGVQQRGKAGTPDILACIAGKFVAIEIKDVGKKPTPLQKYNLEGITKANGYGLVVDKSNWDQMKDFLNALANGD